MSVLYADGRNHAGAKVHAAWSIAAYILIVAAAFCFNHISGNTGWLFLAAGVGVPLFTSTNSELKQMLGFRTSGWLIAGSLAILGAILFYAGLLAVVKGYLNAMIFHPGLKESLKIVCEKFFLALPLAFVEEFFFRGYLQEKCFAPVWQNRSFGFLTCKNLAVSLLFGLGHGVSHLSLWACLTLFGSLILGWVVEKSDKSILPAAGLHAVSNAGTEWFRLIAGMNVPL
jgi:membrane protease YdiL (CAAX protease family)